MRASILRTHVSPASPSDGGVLLLVRVMCRSVYSHPVVFKATLNNSLGEGWINTAQCFCPYDR